MPNSTHRKRLARAYAAQTGLTYMAALDAVNKAATSGRLPARLDDAGMQAALRILATNDSATPTVISAAIAAALDASDPTNRDRKVASNPADQHIYDLSAVYERLSGKQGLIYISSPGSGKDRYVFGGVGGGHVALGREEALAHISGLLNIAAAHLGTGHRRPYIGEGADGARRSARIDREEADGLDRDDPLCDDLLASAQRWEDQAEHLDTITAATTDAARASASQAEASDPQAEELHLEKSSLLRLRETWQGRVTIEPYRDGTRFSIDDKPASAIKDLELRWLADNGYLTATLLQGEEWAIARTTDFGDTVLAAHGADTDKFRDGLPAAPATRADTARGLDFETTRQADGRGLLAVREQFLATGRIEWWWHTGPFAGLHGFKTVERATADGDLVLRDEDPQHLEPHTTLTLDFIDDPDKAARHLIWPDNTGVTLCDKVTGQPDATYRVAASSPPRVGDLLLDKTVDRRLGGPNTTKVYNARNQRVNATCDVCNRRLATKEAWWMVRSPERGWENNLGVACGRHHPDRLPVETSGDTTAPRVAAATPSAADMDVSDQEQIDQERAEQEVRARLRTNLLVQTRSNEVLQISEVEERSVTAQVVYPLPPRTTVRRYTYAEAATWREPSDAMVAKYDKAWGFTD